MENDLVKLAMIMMTYLFRYRIISLTAPRQLSPLTLELELKWLLEEFGPVNICQSINRGFYINILSKTEKLFILF